MGPLASNVDKKTPDSGSHRRRCPRQDCTFQSTKAWNLWSDDHGLSTWIACVFLFKANVTVRVKCQGVAAWLSRRLRRDRSRVKAQRFGRSIPAFLSMSFLGDPPEKHVVILLVARKQQTNGTQKHNTPWNLLILFVTCLVANKDLGYVLRPEVLFI